MSHFEKLCKFWGNIYFSYILSYFGKLFVNFEAKFTFPFCISFLEALWQILTLFYMGGIKLIPPDWLSYTNPRGTPWMDWFFMTLFLSILERSWVGHFWDVFLKFPKNFTLTIFSIYNPKGGPFYALVRTPFACNFFVLFWVKNGNNSTPNA